MQQKKKQAKKKEKSNDQETHSLIRGGSNECKELSKQHAVSWFIAAVFYGQRLQQGEWAAAMAGRVVSSPNSKKR